MKRYFVAAAIIAIAYMTTHQDSVSTKAEAITVPGGTLTTRIQDGSVEFKDDGTVDWGEPLKVTVTDDSPPGPSKVSQIPDREKFHQGKEFSEKHKRAEKQLAGMLFGECRGENIQCMYAVGHVAMNRARLNLDKRYGKGLWGVLNKRKAFSCFNENDPNLKSINLAMAGKLKPDSIAYKKWELAQDIAHDLMHRSTEDPTNSATHYHANWMRARWADDKGMVKTVKLAGHTFYRFGS